MPGVEKSKIRVFLVDDSALDLELLRRLLERSDDIEVIGTARDGAEALAAIPSLRPDVVCTDLHMPQLDGEELTRRIMSESPRPILVVTSSKGKGSQTAFRLIEAGAIDVVAKPRGGAHAEAEANDLVRLVRIAAGVHVVRRRIASPTGPSVTPRAPTTVRVIVVGASTGGPQALATLLGSLPPSFPVPILVVQHMTAGFLPGLVGWLRGRTALDVQIATHGVTPLAGSAYFAPPDLHLEIDSVGRMILTPGPPVEYHRPSATVLFRSAAARFGAAAVGALLTGMGRDGADGMVELRRVGAVTIAQDAESCAVAGMPVAAAKAGGASHVLPITEIAGVIEGLVR